LHFVGFALDLFAAALDVLARAATVLQPEMALSGPITASAARSARSFFAMIELLIVVSGNPARSESSSVPM
jgi:hypothetical protein